MSYTFQLGVAQTYFLYISTVLMATFFAALSQKFAIKVEKKPIRVNKFFWFLSFLSLAIPLGFRGSGVDNEGYMQIYDSIRMWDTGYSYQGFPEPLFMLLNYVIVKTVDNLQYVYIISGFISLIFIYKTLAKKIGELDLALSVWVFCFSFYFYMYGLVRISIAMAIMTFALQYLEKNNMKKYIIWSIIAGLFHYSAFIIIPIFFFIGRKRTNTSKKIKLFNLTIIVVVIVPIIFILGVEVFSALFNNFSWFGRYSKYLDITTELGVLKGIVWALPILVVLFMWGNHVERSLKHYVLYVNMFGVMLSFAILSIFFGVQRLTYFMYPSCFYLYASVLRLPFSKNEKRTVHFLYWMGMIVFGLLWMILVVLGGDNWKSHMFPYYFNIP